MTSHPAANKPPLPRWAIATVLTLLFILAAQIVISIHGQSLTWDEGDHIFAGYQTWRTHDYGLNPEHPPMVKMLDTLPRLPLHLNVPPLQNRYFKDEAYMDGQQLLFHNGPADGNHYSAETLTFRARLPTLLFTLACALLVFFAAREMFSLRAGLIALTLFCFEPNILAHGAYVTTDIAASTTIFATIYLFWRYTTKPSLARLAAVGLAAGLALAAKHSTILLAPMLTLLAIGELVRHIFGCPIHDGSIVMGGLESADPAEESQGIFKTRTLLRTTLHLTAALIAITLIAVTILWAFYGFRYNARPAGLTLSPSLTDYVGPLAGIEARGILLAARFHLLPESYLYGLADVRKMANDMPSYFFGRVYLHGLWYYFPVLFTIKSTLSMLALLALTIFAIARGTLRNYRALYYLIAPPALYFVVAMSSHLNIGARHILPVWIFCCVLAAAGISALIDNNPRWLPVAAVLLLFHAATSLRTAPNYIPYANEAWGGPTHTYRYLSDSNTDWAQQLIATSTYLRDRHITHCSIAYFAAPFILPQDYGIPCRLIPTPDTLFTHTILDAPAHIDTRTDGPLLISAGDLSSFELGSSVLNPYQPLAHAKPVAFIQDGIFVFEGTFDLPLAAALAHVQRSTDLLKSNNIPAALSEAEQAQTIAPNFVQPELALGDAATAAGNNQQARDAYLRAQSTINTMDPDARTHWQSIIQMKLASL
jgi:hypothetical protein